MFLQQRRLILRTVEGLSDAQLNETPSGRSNNIAWNLGHLITSHQGLIYRLSSLPMRIPDAFAARFVKETSPADWSSPMEGEELRARLLETAQTFEEDLAEGIFKEFMPYETSNGVSIGTFEESISFNNFHEGLHLGIILAIRKQIGA